MAEVLPSSFRLQATETADTVFSRLLIGSLFKDQTFQPGRTFTDKYTERGGQIYIRRLGKPNVIVSDARVAGGMKFTHAQTADSLVMIPRYDRVNVSEEIYEIVDTLRSSGRSVEKVNEVIEAWKEKCQIQYMSYLLKTPAIVNQVEVGGAMLTADSGGLASATLDDLILSMTNTIKQIRYNGGRPSVILINPDMVALFQQAAIKFGNAYIPQTNEELVRTGNIGKLFGINLYDTNLIGAGTPIAIPVAGNALPNTGNAANCEYIIYDHDTFGIAADLWAPRLIPAIDFTGSYGQCDSIMGGGVANPALAYAKVNAEVIE